MADLGELMGTIISSISQARRIADEESAAIAEYYKDNPLLAGLSVPRLRIPEIVIDLPVLLESHEDKTSFKLRPKAQIQSELLKRLQTSAAENKITIPSIFSKTYAQELNRQLTAIESNPSTPPSREVVMRASDISFSRAFRASQQQIKLTPQQSQALRTDLRQTAGEMAIEEEGLPPRLNATIMTADVKDKSDPTNVTRIKLTLKEEGLEWSSTTHEDGSVTNHLTAE